MAALVSLGAALIESSPGAGQQHLKLATHRCRYGIVAGLYSKSTQLSSDSLDLGLRLLGNARQPLASITHTSGASLFVADWILKSMQLQLKVSRHHGLRGFGVILPANKQLQLV
jgi:hypothetical protein